MLTKNDYTSFWKTNDIKDVKCGAYNIWLYNDDNNYGFKIFFYNEGGAPNWLHRPSWPGSEIESNELILSKEDMEDMFQLSYDMFKMDYCPQPIKLIEHGSLRAILMQKVDIFTGFKSEDGNFHNYRHRKMLAEMDEIKLRRIFPQYHILEIKSQYNHYLNFGLHQILEIKSDKDKIMWVDLDFYNLKIYQEYLGEKMEHTSKTWITSNEIKK